eukprot:4619831-Prymnesium_polylepis.1
MGRSPHAREPPHVCALCAPSHARQSVMGRSPHAREPVGGGVALQRMDHNRRVGVGTCPSRRGRAYEQHGTSLGAPSRALRTC